MDEHRDPSAPIPVGGEGADLPERSPALPFPFKGITVNEPRGGEPADLTRYVGGPPVEAKR